MNRNMTKFSLTFVFAALFILSVGSAQAAGSIWFSGQDQYRPVTHTLNGGFCASTTNNNENIYLSTGSGMKQETKAGICILSMPDGRNYNIWLQGNTP